ncbi:unnamed protein product [Diamesa hyperborea]
MYRLLSFKHISSVRWVTNRKNSFVEENRNFHSLILYNSRLLTFNGNTVNAELMKRLIKKKKKKSKLKKYTELLQVTENSSKQTTTAVYKLAAKKLSDFIDETEYLPSKSFLYPPIDKLNSLEYSKFTVDMMEHESLSNGPIVFVGTNVDELNLTKDGLREIVESFNAYRELTTAPETLINEEHMEEEIEEEHLDPVQFDTHIAPKSSSKTKEDDAKKSKSRFKSKFHKSFEMEKLSKQKSLAVSLSAYLDCCVSTGMLNRGFVTLLNYRYKYKKYSGSATKINDINLYNILVHGYAEKENLIKVKEILAILKEDLIDANHQTYAAVYECLGRVLLNPASLQKNQLKGDEDVVKYLNQIYIEAIASNITLNDIMDKSIFLKDQRTVVLHAIHMIVPTFAAVYTPPELGYSNKLLNPLNQNIKEITYETHRNLETKLPGSNIMNSKEGFSREKLEEVGKEQLQNELTGYVTVKSIEKFPDPNPTILHYRGKLTELQNSWRHSIMMAFNRDLNTLRNQAQSKSNRSINLLPYLRALELEDYADIVLREIRMLAEGSETYSPTVGQLYKALGNKVQVRYQMEQKKQNGILKKTGEIYGNYCDVLAHCNGSDNPRQLWQRLVYQKSNEGPSMDYSEKSWPGAAQIGVGRFLYNILMRDLKIDVNVIRITKQKTPENLLPAFYTLFRNQGRIVKEEVKPHPVLSRLYRGSQQETLTFEANQVPMLCPPQPWNNSKTGGYLLANSELIRLPQTAHQQFDRIENTPLHDLYPALDSLNQLASVPWTINKELLDVILEVFNNGGNDKLDVPQPPNSLPAIPTPDPTVEITKTQKFLAFRQKLMHRRKQSEMYSLWCDALYRLSLANHYRDRVFWLPHNMDFRGRVYPVPPHLNHLGSDLARSLLVFHQAKPLGIDGFSWLKLHCINLTGLKKRDSVRERLLYAQEIMDDILDSADNPLTGKMWWTKSDEPWQTLSCCMEIAKVHRSPCPEEFMSSFPIHQDGSCNGLQHYAALGRDSAGAISVNLSPSAIPQDVYSGVATLVEQAREKDEEAGVEVAKILREFVRRKVIKQTVMTTVYGVTRFGARLQIAKQLKDLDEFPKEWVWPASTYLTNKTFDSIREMFTSTKEIQDWFTDCAKQISTVCGQNVEWITPLGLPVVQPYNRQEKFKAVNSKSVKLDQPFAIDMFVKPNVMKQKNAFPPNFIHSLDSSHMMLTSLFCEKAGLTFISVHDCFWTHACTVPEMNKLCREQFVALHSEPILEDLSEYMINKYSFHQKDFSNDGSVGDMSKRKLNRILTMVPEKGDFDLNNVLKSIYFFS